MGNIHPRSRIGPCRIAVAIPAPTFLSASFHTLFVINFVLILVLRFPKTLKGGPVKLVDVVFAAILMNIAGSQVCLAKTSYTCKMNDLRKARFGLFRYILPMIVSLRHFLGWLVSVFRSREDLVLKTWLSVGNCWLCTRNNLAVD